MNHVVVHKVYIKTELDASSLYVDLLKLLHIINQSAVILQKKSQDKGRIGFVN